jgi:predicted nucleic acid-binding Zn ribbon protein
MKYNFICKSCGAEEEKEIAIKDYDEEKTKQICSNCGAKMQRVIEWGGIATGSGDGWFGKSDGGTAI